MDHLIKLGILPSHLSTIKPPSYLAYLLGRSKKKPWRHKNQTPTIRHLYQDALGTTVSVDQLVSSILGIKPQATGTLTKASIVGAQIFANHCCTPPYLYCQLLESFSSDDAIRAKVRFE